ncbi:ParB/RepB/Spo0J family partition protein [Thioalkalivibrio sp. HK1]|uniref:ParB/RepB/Spo0J family partition protein n=1 Tax=Thioalkalivibrio sp. HK1 TaxID=1469245 RepID=UPI00046EC4B4|nr:ParB/RepB/Spo0J family partition protein [Thioalkalivibrio sp. HK1]
MAKKRRRGLGRGLDALLGDISPEVMGESAADMGSDLRSMPVDLIRPGRYQPRRSVDQSSIDDLARSIRVRGIVQPIVVRPIEGKEFEIIAGERRWRAAQAAELHTVPAIVRDCPDEEAAAIALIENIQREDLNPIEEAEGFRTLAEEFGLTHGQLAEAVGRSRPSISNALRLLDLNPDVRTLVQRGDLQMGHARALLGIKGTAQSTTAKEVVRRGLSTGETERLVRSKAPGKRATEGDGTSTRRDADLQRMENDLGERLGTQVRIDHKKSGAGRLVIHYAGLDALDGILERIR